MARTFNRRPFSVDTPSSNDSKNYYFTTANWKGLVDNKNYATVDQETFSDCSNVYVDEYNLLKSRPVAKLSELDEKLKGYGITKAINLGDITCYECAHRILVFVDDKNNKLLEVYYNGSYYVTRVENSIYLFSNNIEKYEVIYDNNGNITLSDVIMDNIYIPVTSVISNGVKSNNEPMNELTQKYKERYLYNDTYSNYVPLYGKNVTVEMDGSSYDMQFNEYTPRVLLTKCGKLSSNYVAKHDVLGQYFNGKYMLEFSSIGTMVRSSYIESSTGTITWFNEYSPDGKSYVALPYLEGQTTPAKISDDGTHVFAYTNSSLYVISVLNTKGSDYFSTWTDVFKHFGLDEEDSFSSWFDETDVNNVFNSLHAKSINEFVCALASVPGVISGVTCYSYVRVVYIKDGKIWENVFYDRSEPPYMPLNERSNVSISYIGRTYVIVFGMYSNSRSYVYELNYTIPGNSNRLTTFTPNYFKCCRCTDEGLLLVVYGKRQGPDEFGIQCDVYELKNYEFILNENLSYYSITDATQAYISANGDILTNYYLTDNKNIFIELPITSTPLYMSTNLIYTVDYRHDMYSNVGTKSITVVYEGNDTVIEDVNFSIELDEHYFFSKDKMYISKYPAEGGFKWYFPKTYTETLPSTVINALSLNESELIVNCVSDSIVVAKVENGFTYYKSKFALRPLPGTEIMHDFTGKYIIAPSARGIALLTYQDFVASTEQTVTYITDSVQCTYDAFNVDGIKMVKFKFYIIFYKENDDELLVFDARTNTWWPWKMPEPVKQLYTVNDKVHLISSSHDFEFTTTTDDYSDDVNSTTSIPVPWYIKSQRLHLNGINYLKHISNITLSAVSDNEVGTLDTLSMDMVITNYRKQRNELDVQSFEFDVDSVRLYVKKLNYFKVNEFQYLLKSNEESVKFPLCLSNITIKYKIAGQVR